MVEFGYMVEFDRDIDDHLQSYNVAGISIISLTIPFPLIFSPKEFCAQRGMTPTYDLVANEGAVHEPVFVYRVVVGEIVATGKGPSKKKAKHVAAQEALERIRQVVASAAGDDDDDDEDGMYGNNNNNNNSLRRVFLTISRDPMIGQWGVIPGGGVLCRVEGGGW